MFGGLEGAEGREEDLGDVIQRLAFGLVEGAGDLVFEELGEGRKGDLVTRSDLDKVDRALELHQKII